MDMTFEQLASGTLLVGLGGRLDVTGVMEIDLRFTAVVSTSRAVIVDMSGKHGRVRSVPMPAFVKDAIDVWSTASGPVSGRVFRGVNKGDHVTGASLDPQGVWRQAQPG